MGFVFILSLELSSWLMREAVGAGHLKCSTASFLLASLFLVYQAGQGAGPVGGVYCSLASSWFSEGVESMHGRGTQAE